MIICYYIFILCIEEYEKLKANVTMLTEEKLQLQDKLEISTSGKTISILIVNFIVLEIEKFKNEISDKDILIAKLMKKESQLKEELQSMKDISTDTKSIQCDYWTKAG